MEFDDKGSDAEDYNWKEREKNRRSRIDSGINTKEIDARKIQLDLRLGRKSANNLRLNIDSKKYSEESKKEDSRSKNFSKKKIEF